MGCEVSPGPLDLYMAEAAGPHLKWAKSPSKQVQPLVSSRQLGTISCAPSFGTSTGKVIGSMATKVVMASSLAGVSKLPLPLFLL